MIRSHSYSKVMSSLAKDIRCVSSGKVDQNDRRRPQSIGADAEEFLKHRTHHDF